MQYLTSLGIGYLLGMLSPAAFFSKKKNVDMKNEGTGNLGASNAWITLGKSYFFIIMVLDICKSWLSAKIAWKLFPGVAAAGFVASIGAMLGHIFPFYMNFKGGKGLAAFGGMVCAYDLRLAGFYIVTGLVLLLIFNHSWILPCYAALTFPFFVWFATEDVTVTLVVVLASVLLIIAHWENLRNSYRGTDGSVRKEICSRLKQ